ncbi:MAG: TatD family hydrolase [Dehalococcoidia bacterium]
MLVDSHCHLQDRKYRADVEDVIHRAFNSGVTALVTIGYDMPSSRRAIEIADAHDNIYATVGVHPHDAKTLTARDLNELSRMADSSRVVAIGEIGLDFYRDLSPRDEQYRAFREQLALAKTLRLPVVIHSRDADEQVFEVLTEYEREARADWPKDRPIGVMHCYAGDLPLALRYIDIGFVISIAGPVTYARSEATRAVASGIPLRWMAVETDAPYLPPQRIRGERNEPANVCDVAEFVANLRGTTFAEVADKTAQTASSLFGLGDIGQPLAEAAKEAR